MSEVAFDRLGRRHVILAPERARRGAPPVEATLPDPEPCDFCGGREDRTPPETFAIRPRGGVPDSPGWTVRVVPNLYAATPFHEVVVHTPDHHTHFEQQGTAYRADVLRTYRARLRDAPTRANVIVWNRGKASGASRTHAHGQIFGLERTPPTLEREAESLADSPCVLCEMAGDADLAVTEIAGCHVFAHPVPLVAGEVLIVPPHTPRLETVEDELLAPVAEALAQSIGLTLAVLGEGVPFNLVIHTAPADVETFHWHAHLMPRIAVWGGLEMGAEMPIVAADPHQTAAALRAARPS